MVRRYANPVTAALRAAHERVSLLSSRCPPGVGRIRLVETPSLVTFLGRYVADCPRLSHIDFALATNRAVNLARTVRWRLLPARVSRVRQDEMVEIARTGHIVKAIVTFFFGHIGPNRTSPTDAGAVTRITARIPSHVRYYACTSDCKNFLGAVLTCRSSHPRGVFAQAVLFRKTN